MIEETTLAALRLNVGLAANASHKHDMPYNTIMRAGVGKVTVCKKCGLARKKIGSRFHYFDGKKELGTAILCQAANA